MNFGVYGDYKSKCTCVCVCVCISVGEYLWFKQPCIVSFIVHNSYNKEVTGQINNREQRAVREKETSDKNQEIYMKVKQGKQ